METYLIRTFGCQMNKHDSERVAGLLNEQGMSPVVHAEDADVVVFMTCCVRENADERLRGQARSLKSTKAGRPGQLIAVGGCIGQRDGEKLIEQVPHLDVVFGTHNVGRLPALLETARRQRLPQVEVWSEAQGFASDLPTEREHPWHAWVPIAIGCDNFCSYCVVPYVRGREKSRPLEQIEAEVRGLVADGVREVTLLGQNVNSYGRDLYGDERFARVSARGCRHRHRPDPVRHVAPQGPLGRDHGCYGGGPRGHAVPPSPGAVGLEPHSGRHEPPLHQGVVPGAR